MRHGFFVCLLCSAVTQTHTTTSYEPFLRSALLQVVRRVDEAYAREESNTYKDFWIGVLNIPAVHK